MADLQTLKPLGAYLIEAGLLSQAQVDVVLADQTNTEMQFGEIVVTRGWLKEQTIEYLMQKVVLPEREALQHDQAAESLPLRPLTVRSQPPVRQPTPPTPVVPAQPQTPPPREPSGKSSSHPSKAYDPSKDTLKQEEETPVQRVITANFPDDEFDWVG